MTLIPTFYSSPLFYLDFFLLKFYCYSRLRQTNVGSWEPKNPIEIPTLLIVFCSPSFEFESIFSCHGNLISVCCVWQNIDNAVINKNSGFVALFRSVYKLNYWFYIKPYCVKFTFVLRTQDSLSLTMVSLSTSKLRSTYSKDFGSNKLSAYLSVFGCSCNKT